VLDESTASKYLSNFACSQHWSAPPSTLEQILETCSIMDSKFAQSWHPKCISTHVQLRPQRSHDCGLLRAPPSLLNHSLEVSTIRASKCIAQLTLAWRHSSSLSTVDNSLKPPSTIAYNLPLSLLSTWISKVHQSQLLSLHHHGLQVNLHTRSITASEGSSEFPRTSSRSLPRIALMHHLQPVHIY
jgi:hypothetical protein